MPPITVNMTCYAFYSGRSRVSQRREWIQHLPPAPARWFRTSSFRKLFEFGLKAFLSIKGKTIDELKDVRHNLAGGSGQADAVGLRSVLALSKVEEEAIRKASKERTIPAKTTGSDSEILT